MKAQSPPRVLMLLHGYFPGEPRVAAEARAAVEAGFEVDVIALRRSEDPPNAVVSGARVWRLPVEHNRGAGLITTAREYTSFVLRSSVLAARLARRQRYDVLHVHSPPDFLVLAAAVPRVLGSRSILDVHDLASDMFVMRFENRLGIGVADRILRSVERWAARASSEVLTVHEPYRRELAARGIPLEKITVVMNALDERLLPPPSVDRIDTGDFVVAYHGTITPHYGVALLVEAVAVLRDRVPGIRARILGEGDAVPTLRRRVRELGVENLVEISERYLPQKEVLLAVRDASVGVVPNLPTRLNRYALSTKLLEYVALGVPVVSADLPTIREHFSDAEIRYFRAGDAASLADALAEVAANPESAQQRALEARRRYDEYRWEHSAKAYVDVLRRAAERS